MLSIEAVAEIIGDQEPFTKREAFIWLIEQGARDAQIAVTLSQAKKAWRWNSRSRVSRFLTHLAALNAIEISSYGRNRMITIKDLGIERLAPIAFGQSLLHAVAEAVSEHQTKPPGFITTIYS